MDYLTHLYYSVTQKIIAVQIFSKLLTIYELYKSLLGYYRSFIFKIFSVDSCTQQRTGLELYDYHARNR